MKLTLDQLDAAMLKKSPGFFIVGEPQHAIEYLKRNNPWLIDNEYIPSPHSERDLDYAFRAAMRRKAAAQTYRKRKLQE